MCRWFAYISPTEPCLLEDVIVSSKHSLTNQVHEHYLPGLVAHHPRDISKDHLIIARNVIYNIDGVGIVWYTSSNADFERGDTGESGDGTLKQGLRPSMYKSVQPPANDLNYRSICANTETRVLMAHIRAASGTPIVPVNNHPFIFGRHSFMHNGAVADFSTLKLDLCQKMSKAAYLTIKGGTDSEHMAALYVSYLTNFGDETSFEQEYSAEQMGTAMTAMVTTILELQATMLGTKAKPNSLNLCATDGVKMIACRFRNHTTQEPPSLYYSTTAGTTLNRKYPDNPDGNRTANRFTGKAVEDHGKHIIIASEPSTYKESDWHLIPRNSLVTASAEHGVQVSPISYKKEWDAEDPTVLEGK